MKSLIDKVGARNLIAAVIVGLGVAGVVLVATGQFSDDDKRPSSVARTARPSATPAVSTPSPHSFPDAPADEASRGTARYGGQRSSGDSYNPYYGSEDDDDAAEAYYGYYGYPYGEDDDDGESYVPPPPSDDDGGSGTGGEPGQPGHPYGDGDGGGGAGGEGGPGGAGGGG